MVGSFHFLNVFSLFSAFMFVPKRKVEFSPRRTKEKEKIKENRKEAETEGKRKETQNEKVRKRNEKRKNKYPVGP